jgi:hypothetical protein
VIRRPEPTTLRRLADLYDLSFPTLASWVGYQVDADDEGVAGIDRTLLREVSSLTSREKLQLLGIIAELRQKATGRSSSSGAGRHA